MKTPEHDPLRDLIAPLRTPPVSAEHRDRTLALALAALPEGARQGGGGHGWRPWVALAGALGVVLFAAWWWRPVPPVRTPEEKPGLIFAEMEKLFPQQLDSVIVDGTDVQVNVSPAPAATPDDQRIRLILRRSGRSLGVLTYSGRQVCLRLDGRDVCLTPLLRGDGSVFVLTKDQVILDEAAALPSGHHVHMEHLRGVDS